MRSGIPDIGQAAKAGLVVGAGHRTEQPQMPRTAVAPPFFTHPQLLRQAVDPWRRHMRNGEEPKVDDAIKEIAALLAAAYQRRASIRLVRATPEPTPSTEELAISGVQSVHGLTLTRQRKESLRL
jgi:hypothetical protein